MRETDLGLILPQGAYCWHNLQAPTAWRERPYLVVCDHASNYVPQPLGDLGVEPAHFERHVAYDIGALNVSKIIAEQLGAALVHTTCSRLVLDVNRNPALDSFIPQKSDDVSVRANHGLSESQKRARQIQLFDPYHQQIDRYLALIEASTGLTPALISIHSFTPQLASRSDCTRPWHYGIMWENDRRLAAPLIAALAKKSSAPVGDNQPYSAQDSEGETGRIHGTHKGRATALIEIRQDLIKDALGQQEHALIMAQALKEVLQDFDFSAYKPV